MTSTSGLVGNVGQANYAAAKLGIVGLTRVTALDMARYNVTANCISPFAWTRLIGTIPTDTPEQKARVAKLEKMSPATSRRWRRYLASDDAEEVSGQIFGVRGKEIFLFSPASAGALDPPRRRLDPRAPRRDLPRHARAPPGAARELRPSTSATTPSSDARRRRRPPARTAHASQCARPDHEQRQGASTRASPRCRRAPPRRGRRGRGARGVPQSSTRVSSRPVALLTRQSG